MLLQFYCVQRTHVVEWLVFYDYVIIMSQLFPWTIILPMEGDVRVRRVAPRLVQTGQFSWNN